MAFFDRALQFARVLDSIIDSGPTSELKFTIEGAPGIDDDGQNERVDDAPDFTALGVRSRPPAPETIDNAQYFDEVVCIKTGDGLVPIAHRDLRLHRLFKPNKGTTALVGYGGGFFSLDLGGVSGSQKANIMVAYCPYDFDSNGVAQKAHTLVLDPFEGISFVHADGYAICANADGLTLRSETGKARITLKDDQITGQASKIIWQGNVVVGANPVGALPVLAGAASPPCPSLFFSPV